MPNQKEILGRIRSVNIVKQMTKTMKMISVSKYNSFLKILKDVNIYLNELQQIKNKIHFIDATEKVDDPLKLKTLLITISSDNGFCGNFNNNICKKTISYLKKQNLSLVDIIPIGRKINDFLLRNKYKCISEYVGLLKKFNINEMSTIIDGLLNNGTYNKVSIIYNHFINVSNNITEEKTFNLFEKLNVNEDCQILFEPNKKEVYGKLKNLDIRTQMIICIIESCVAEYGVRMVNMNKSTDNAEALLKKLKTLFNQTRQTSITNEIIEISAGFKNT